MDEHEASALIKYIPSSEKEAILALSCVGIDVVAHEKLPNGGNHWAFYLYTTDDTSYIQLDASPSYSIPATKLSGGSKAFMIVSHYVADTDNHAVTKRVSLAVRKAPTVTVGEIVKIFSVKNQRHRYEFDSQGLGCRQWIWDQIPLLVQEGVVVDKAQVDEAQEAILLAFPEGVPYPMAAGEYY